MIPIFIAAWFLVSAVDDFIVLVAWIGALLDRREGPRWPASGELMAIPEQRIAIFVPAWREEAVIARMLEQNTAALRYSNYKFLVGTYPNDRATQEAVRSVAERDKRIALVIGPRPGPTSKADCLNALYKRMCELEVEEGRFDLVMIHDAEDVMHPDELHWKNWFAASYDMVQTAVLPLATPAYQLTHGVYCDDFAEYHTKDLRARNWLGGFVPSCGVATAFAREQVEGLAVRNLSGLPFSPDSLTEDYDVGYRLHCQGARQVFIPLPASSGPRLSTREFFPQNLRAAVRQRSRWVTGIAFQGWRNHGWGRNPSEFYWFWRDRKGIVGSPLSLVASLVLIFRLSGGRLPWLESIPARMLFVIAVLSFVNLAARSWCSGRMYGWPFGLFAPIRQLWGNLVNTLAIATAALTVVHSLRSGAGLAWRKTHHAYPWMASAETRSLGEVLVNKGFLTTTELKQAVLNRPVGVGFAEYLWRVGRLTPEQLQSARNEQHGLGGETGPAWSASLLIPAQVAERWRVVPVGIAEGELRLASVEIPERGLEQELARQTRLRPRLILVTPARFGVLKAQFQGRSQRF